MESLSLDPRPFQPKTGSIDAWNEAYVRVEDYLRAHRVHNRLQQNRIISEVLRRAAERHAQNPAQAPSVLAAEELIDMMDSWYGRVLGENKPVHQDISIDGRLTMLLHAEPGDWSHVFSNDEKLWPSDFTSMIKTARMQAGPELAVSHMVAREIDLGPISNAAGETLSRIEQWPWLRTGLLWCTFIIALSCIFFFTR